jgi:Do/DeqQ family serine protease
MKKISEIALFVARYSVIGLAIAFVALIVTSKGGFSYIGAGNSPGEPPGNSDAFGLRASFADAVENASPAVVSIFVEKTVTQRSVTPLYDPLLQRFTGGAVLGAPKMVNRNELGSGVIIDSNGHILTNAHVISNADNIHVALWDGRLTEARVVGSDEETDIAVLQVALEGLPSLPFADAKGLRIGDVVLAIGNPLGLGKTVTMGIVSATGRAGLAITDYENFIQTDAAINRGNSGGALINSSGQLVGINTATLGPEMGVEGIGFAIPIDMANNVMQQILTHGQVVRGWLGVQSTDSSRYPWIIAQAGNRPGILIGQVYRGSPGEAAGLRPLDFLTGFDGQPVDQPRDLLNRIAEMKPGTEVELEFWRNGQRFTASTDLIKRPRHLSGSG